MEPKKLLELNEVEKYALKRAIKAYELGQSLLQETIRFQACECNSPPHAHFMFFVWGYENPPECIPFPSSVHISKSDARQRLEEYEVIIPFPRGLKDILLKDIDNTKIPETESEN